MVILDREQFGLACFEPPLGRRSLALGAMAVAAGVVGDLGPVTVLAAQGRGRPARHCGSVR